MSQQRRGPVIGFVLFAQEQSGAVVAAPRHAWLLANNPTVSRIRQQRNIAAHRPQHLGVRAQHTEPDELVVIDHALWRPSTQLPVQYLGVEPRNVLKGDEDGSYAQQAGGFACGDA